jgi:hypothetical protein
MRDVIGLVDIQPLECRIVTAGDVIGFAQWELI